MQRLISQLLMLFLLVTPVIGHALPCPMGGDSLTLPSHSQAEVALPAEAAPCHQAASSEAPPSQTAHAGMPLADCLSALSALPQADGKAVAPGWPLSDLDWLADRSVPPEAAASLARPPAPKSPAESRPANLLWADSQRLLL